VRRPFWAAAVVTALIVAVGQDARANAALHCGATITADTRLTSDLTNCSSVGLIIGADDVTLDLGGHTVTGDGVSDVEGIRAVGHDHVVIENGSVRNFVEGVVIIRATTTRVRRLRLSGHRHVGVLATDSSDVSIDHTTSRHIRFSALFAARSSRVRIAHNTVTTSGGGVFLDRVAAARVSGNRITSNGQGIALQAADRGRVIRNQVSYTSDGDGIFLGERSTNVLVGRNRLVGNAGGIGLADGAHANVVSTNLSRGNAFVGIYLFGADDNRLVGNLVLHNGDGSEGGIHVLSNDAGASSNGNVLRGNLLVGNVGDGILVDRGQRDTALTANRVFDSTDDGIDARAAATTLGGNAANGNNSLGIRAVLGVVDAGANRAHGNGDRRECVNVRCFP
jgi:large repetitive protein